MKEIMNQEIKNQDIKPVLAMYDIRSKQEFIFRTNKLKEIIGGSWIIRDCFKDYLYPIAEALYTDAKGIYKYNKDNPIFFERELMKHFETYIGELVYDGGGNFLIIYRNEEVYKKVTYEFTKALIENIGTLHVIGTYISLLDDQGKLDLSDCIRDRDKLYEKHRETEGRLPVPQTCMSLPITQMDRKTIQPLIHEITYSADINTMSECEKRKSIDVVIDAFKKTYEEKNYQKCVKLLKEVDGNTGKYTKEQYQKRLKFGLEMSRINGSNTDGVLSDIEKNFYKYNEKILDNIVEKKGEDSKLAVVYIDGNSMGAKVQSCIKGDENKKDDKSYETILPKLRNFSKEINELYVEKGVTAAFKDIDNNESSRFRIVVSAGDEINFIVKAKDAFNCATNYLKALKENNEKNNDNASACAGIAVFNSHFPYSEAYRIAEECCETGKKMMKKKEQKCASYIDFHICQGAIGNSLEDIRERENGKVISRPWMMWSQDDKSLKKEYDGDENNSGEIITAYEDVEKVIDILTAFGRSNVKGLADVAKESPVKLLLELRRIWAHCNADTKSKYSAGWTWLQNMEEQKRRNIIYDVVTAYDIWFREEKKDI